LKTPLDISSGLTRDQKKHKKVCGALSYPTTTDIKIAQKKKTKKNERKGKRKKKERKRQR